jgi:hypothetical protein
MNRPCTILLSWVGLTALGLVASALIVLGELRIDADAMAGLQASHAMVPGALPEQEACGPASSLAAR